MTGVGIATVIGVPFIAALATLVLTPRWAGRVALLAALVVVAAAVPAWLALTDAVQLIPLPWMSSFAGGMSFRVDRIGLFFVLLVGGIGVAVVQYSRAYVAAAEAPGFWPLLLVFMGAMGGLALSDSLLLFFVFWELTTLSSALLIALHVDEREARLGALRAFIITGGGGLCLLAGAALIAVRTGTWSLAELAARAPEVIADPLHVPALLLMLLGAFAKSAQFPLHAWLPGAMAAPAPVSAYLHSATMVKAGILLLGRLFPIFATSPLWLPVLVAVGLTTFVVGGWNAMRSNDLKQLLAHSTVSNLGMLTAMYGLYSRIGAAGELVGILNHALYKSALFLLVGWLEKATGTRDFSLLDREHWIRHAPFGGALIGVGALAMAGFPLLLGFVGKESFLAGVLSETGPYRWPMLAAAGLGAAFGVAAALKLFIGTFWGTVHPALDRAPHRHHLSPWLLAVPAVLLVPQLIGGLAPGAVVRAVAGPSTGAEWGTTPAFWHYLDGLLAVGLGIIALGCGLFLARDRLARLRRGPSVQAIYDGVGAAVLGACHRLSHAVQAGGHSRHAMIILVAAVAAAAPGLWAAQWPQAEWSGFHPAWLAAALVTVGAVLAAGAADRTTALVLMAVSGYGLALFYVMLHAPDLALTQALVETVSLILLLLIFRRLPPMRAERIRPPRLAVAAAVGLVFALVTWTAAGSQPRDPSGARQAALAKPAGHGANAVNVILVDIRGADTLGEIAVLGTAALAAIVLLRRRRET